VRWRRISFTATAENALDPFEASCDLLGDGSLVLRPTPGHSPGSMSLLVRRANGPPLLMVGDLTFGVEAMEYGYEPGFGSRLELAESTRRAQMLRARTPGRAILAAHDPAAAELLRQANAALSEAVPA
jgi:glyoxylase-like metal-dependent hydrolase (beta-lactamase superfamily II)